MSTGNKSKAIGPEEKSRAESVIRSERKEVAFDQQDFPIEYLVDRFREDIFYVPDYQRQYIWRQPLRVSFVESVILGLPIPFMFFAQMDDGRFEIVDGVQRVQTLESFLNDDLRLEKLEKLSALEGFRFSDLPRSECLKFKTRPLRVVVLRETTSKELRQEIFHRINTKGEKARSSEVRRGAYEGPFHEFLVECGKHRLFKKLCPISKKQRLRREDEELLLRFFAYSDGYRRFRHGVEKFLDRYFLDHREDFDRDRMKEEFDRMLTFVDRHFPHGFAKGPTSRATPRVRFEAISVGANLALREAPDVVPESTDWLSSDEFKRHTTTHASNSGPRLRGRVEYVRDQLLRGSE